MHNVNVVLGYQPSSDCIWLECTQGPRSLPNHLLSNQGSLKVVISVYPYLQKTPNFSRFYKKLGPFYKKLRCDKFGNWSISTRGLLPSKNDEFHETRGLLPSKNDEFHETRGLLPSKNDEFHENAHLLQKTTPFYKKLNFAYLQKTQTSNMSFINSKNGVFCRDPWLKVSLLWPPSSCASYWPGMFVCFHH